MMGSEILQETLLRVLRYCSLLVVVVLCDSNGIEEERKREGCETGMKEGRINKGS